MPITCRSSDALELLAEDLTEDITRELAQNSFFRVIAAGRNDANGHGAPGADYRIEGKLQAAGENIRLTLQLIDATTGAMLKAARFARTNAEIEAELSRFAERTGRTTAAVRAHLEKDGGISRLATGLRRDKAVDFLRSRATIVGD